MILPIKQCRQWTDSACCGPCCIKMVADYYGIETTKNQLIQLCKTDKEYGTTKQYMKRVLRWVGLESTLTTGKKYIEPGYFIPDLPHIALVIEDEEEHYVVINGCDYTAYPQGYVFMTDPYYGKRWMTIKEFLSNCKWIICIERAA